MKTLMLTGFLLFAFVVAPGCASKAPTPVAAVADTATKIEASATVILQAAVTANSTLFNGAPLISRAALDTVALGVDAIGRAGLTLKTALDDYNVAKAAGKDTTAQVAAVTKILADLNGALAQIGKAIPNGTVQAIDSAAATILSLLAQIKAGVL